MSVLPSLQDWGMLFILTPNGSVMMSSYSAAVGSEVFGDPETLW